MNKKERNRLCSLIAEWEWNTLPGSSDSGSVARCGERLQQEFEVTDEELAFYRAWEIRDRLLENGGKLPDDEDEADAWFDVLTAEIEKDLASVVDQIESMSWGEFASYIESMVER